MKKILVAIAAVVALAASASAQVVQRFEKVVVTSNAADALRVTGQVVASQFNGPLVGNVTGNLAGNVTGNVTGNLSGNVTGNVSGSAGTLAPGRTINGVLFDGSGNITVTATAANALTIGTHLTGTSYNGSSPVTIATDAVSTNTASTLVARDASGNFAAGTITAALVGNASTASAVAASALTGNTLAAGVVTSSLTAVGDLASGSLTSGFTAVSAPLGGTGQTSYAIGDLLYASGATALSKLAAVASGQVRGSAGTGTAPAWSATPTVSSITVGASGVINSSTLNLFGGNHQIRVVNSTGVYIDSTSNADGFAFVSNSQMLMGASTRLNWSINGSLTAGVDTGVTRSAAGVVEVNSGTAGTFRDLLLRTLTSSQTALAATSTDGAVLQNTTAATLAVPVQISTRTRWSGTGWDTDDTVSRTVSFFAEALPSSSSTVAGAWKLGFIDPAAAITYPMTLTSAGDVTFLGGIQTSGAVTMSATALMVYNGRLGLSSGGDGQWLWRNGNLTKGVTWNVAGTDGQVDLKDRSNADLAVFNVHAYKVGGVAGANCTLASALSVTLTVVNGIVTACSTP